MNGGRDLLQDIPRLMNDPGVRRRKKMPGYLNRPQSPSEKLPAFGDDAFEFRSNESQFRTLHTNDFLRACAASGNRARLRVKPKVPLLDEPFSLLDVVMGGATEETQQ
jgi:hypothetical protein